MSVALALLSGFLHAAWNALAKRTRAERGATLATLTLALGVSAVALVIAPWRELPTAALGWTVLAGLGEAVYVFSLGMAYARGDLALSYAVTRASALVFVWPASFLAFGTRPGALDLVATLVVGVGVALCRPRAPTPARAGAAGEPSPPPRAGRLSLGWTLTTGAAIAVYHTGYSGAARAGADALPAFVVAIAIAMPLLWLTLGASVRADATRLLRTPALWLAGALCASSFLLLIVALEHAGSGPMLGVRNASVGFAVIFALVLGERPSAREWAGIATLGAGVAMFAVAEAGR